MIGEREGRADGLATGERDGVRDGDRRADEDSRAQATPPGRQQGREEADKSDARARGTADGLRAGDEDAKAEAERVDYPRGRKNVRDAKWAEAVATEDSLNLKNPPGDDVAAIPVAPLFATFLPNLSLLAGNGFTLLAAGIPSRNFGSPQETQAYNQGYQEGYRSGYDQTFNAVKGQAFEQARREGQRRGADAAERENYRYAFERGHNDGHNAGYAEAFKHERERAYAAAYEQSFRASSGDTYRARFQDYYARHFEAARAEAYRARYDALYTAERKAAHDKKFAEVYPGYAAEAFARGQRDEQEDFRLRPVRLLEAQSTETIVNGLSEPGEALRIRVKLRNFAEGELNGADVRIQLTEETKGSAVLSEPETVLSRGLRPKSVTVVGEALEFRMNENALDEAREFKVRVSYQGRDAGEKTIRVTTKFMLKTSLAETPRLLEGLETKIKIKVQNQARKASDPQASLTLKSESGAIEILGTTAPLGTLAPGAEKIVEYRVIARSRQSEIPTALTVDARTGAGRRIGLLSENRAVPVVNDYRIYADENALPGLRKAGLTRLSYSIRNIGARTLMKSLQLSIRVISADGSELKVVGPNPQFLSPLVQGQTTRFVIPVLAKAANGGGVVELEVKEDGRTVVINRNKF